MSNLLSGLPLVGGLFDDSDQQAIDLAKQNQSLFGGLALPDFKNYSPEDYQVAGKFDPAMAQANTVSEDPSLRQGQLSALSRMAGLSQNGLSDVDQAGFQNARDIGNQMLSSGNAAALQNAQARGVGGSGLEFAMHEMANQGGAQAAQQAGLQQAADSARQRALYTQAYGNQLGQMRAQDFSNNATNSNILNQFNMANTNARNSAQQYNLNNAQNVANMNTQGHNTAQQYNNNMAQQRYQDAYQKAGGQAGANNGVAQGYWAENAANTSNRNANTNLAFQGAMGAGGAPTGGAKMKDGIAGGDDYSQFSNYA